MINIYVGPAIGNVVARHTAEGHGTKALVEDHLPRWREGGLTAAVLQCSDWATIGMLLSEINRSDGELVLLKTRSDYEVMPAGAFGILFSIEGYTSFAGDFDALHILAELGATAFTFSHNVQNVLCTGANERFGEGGFSHLGKATLKELATLPIMVDLVHTSRASFWDALDIYDGDLFVSHSDADAICSHPRNLTDEQIQAVAERNGVIGINSYRGYVKQNPLEATLSDVLDHAMHMYDLVGPEHLAIGLDYWEGPAGQLETVLSAVDPEGEHGLAAAIYAQGPAGMEDISHLGKLVAGLAERGLTQDELDLVFGGSYLSMLERARPTTTH